MRVATIEKIYEWHVENMRSIEIALKHAALSCRQSIADKNGPATRSFVSLYAFLLGASAEDRLRKLLYENPGLNDEDRSKILDIPQQLEKWFCLIEIGFRKHYNVPRAELSENSLPFSANAQFNRLNEMLDVDLRNVIEIRNKLAHGQWVYPFSSGGLSIEQSKYQALQNENIMSLQYKKTMIFSLAEIAHDLIVSPSTFVRDFDAHYRHIVSTRNNLKNRNYIDYERQLIVKRERGILKRRSNKV